MAKNTPAFQFYPRDFMGGVGFISDEACGVYIKIMCVLWEQGNLLPFCLDKIAKVTFTDSKVMHRVWPELEDKFTVEGGGVSHARFSKMMEISAKRREAGAVGGKSAKAKEKQRPSKLGSKPTSKGGANSRRTKTEERRLKNEVGVEDWIFPDGWDSAELRKALAGWEEMRQRIKKPVRSRVSTSKNFKRFDSPEHLIYAAEFCEANDYQGLKPDYRPSKGAASKPCVGVQSMEEQI